jgi:hypothetical protein
MAAATTLTAQSAPDGATDPNGDTPRQNPAGAFSCSAGKIAAYHLINPLPFV